jgi:hypothetical protein
MNFRVDSAQSVGAVIGLTELNASSYYKIDGQPSDTS